MSDAQTPPAASVPWWVWIFVQTTNGKTTEIQEALLNGKP